MSVKHPGYHILEEMKSRNITSVRSLVRETGLCTAQLSRLTSGIGGITYKFAIRLGLVFGTNPWYWLKLQHAYDQSQPNYRAKFLDGLKRASEPTTREK